MATVAEELEHWAQRFARGRVRDIALFRPKLHPGERLAVKVASTGVSQQRADAPLSEWEPRPGSTGLTGRPEGLAYATSERAFVANAGKVSHEWRWSDVFDVRVLPNLAGVVLAPSADAETVDVIASELQVGIASNARERALGWIKFEAAFASWRGELDSWMRAVPARFDQAGQQS